MNTPSKNLMLVFLVVGLVLIVGYSKYKYAEAKTIAKAEANLANCFILENEDDEDGKWVKTPTGSYRRTSDGKCVVGTPPPPVTPKQLAPAERPWTSRTFDVPAEGLREFLYAGSRRYPKLGGVLTHTSGGESYVDRPGVDHDGRNNPDGWFTFLPDPLGSKRQIEIYNRW